MVQFKDVESIVRPKELEINDYYVYVNTNIREVHREPISDVEVGFDGYLYDSAEFTKNEYILLQAEVNKNLEKQVTDTQLALCDVYEML